MGIQKIRSPDGAVMIVMPEQDYNDLVDQIEGRRAEAVQQRLRAGEEEMLTSDDVKASLTMHPLKFWRHRRGLTQAQLGAASGVPQSTIAEIEGGKRKLSRYVTAQALAETLGIDPGTLLQ